jgi:hypothetical protein
VVLPLLGYVQFLGDIEDNSGVLLLFCLVTGELLQSWKQRTLPMEFDQPSRDNLEWNLNFLKSLKPLLFYIEEVLLRVCWDQWFEMRLQLPRNYGIFGIIWTIVGHNPSFTNWHFDPGDFGLAALLYFLKIKNVL